MSEITLRDTVAIAALQGLIQSTAHIGCHPKGRPQGGSKTLKECLSEFAYIYADAMMEERAKTIDLRDI